MNKQEFLVQLRKKLSGLPQDDVEERLSFYCEMIDDHIEEGLSEEAAVSAVGSVDEIVSQIIAEIPLVKIATERVRPKKSLRALEIILLVLGSPIWLSLAFAAVAIIASLYICLWSVVISLQAVFISLIVSSLSCIIAGVIFAWSGNTPAGLTVIASGIVCVGLSIFMFFGCSAATKGVLLLTKKIAISIKNCFIRKVEVL